MRSGIKRCQRNVRTVPFASGELSLPATLHIVAFQEENGRMGFNSRQGRSVLAALLLKSAVWNYIDRRWFTIEKGEDAARAVGLFPALTCLDPDAKCASEMRVVESYAQALKSDALREKYGLSPVTPNEPLLASILNQEVMLSPAACEFLIDNTAAIVRWGSGAGEWGTYAIVATRKSAAFLSMVNECARQHGVEVEDVGDESRIPCW